MRASILAVSMLALVAGACQPAPQDAEVVLTYGSPYTPNHPFGKADVVWIKDVEERSGGRIKVKPYWGGVLLSAAESMIEVKYGLVDVGLITPIYARGGAHAQRVQAGFYGGVQSYADQLAVYDCIAAEFPVLNEELDGLKVLAVQGGNFPGVVTRDRPVRTLADFAGLRLRAPTELTPLLKSLGADPVNMPMGEVYSALAKGVIDGVAAPADTLQSLHFNEVASYYSRVRFARGAYPSRAISQKTWDSLSDADRAILDASGHVWADAMHDLITEADAKGADFGAANGITFVDFDPADQVKLDLMYNEIAAQAAEGLKRDGVDGPPIYARAQEVVAQLNSGSVPECARERRQRNEP
jgi:TRAP-type C4-dicarboxylate transport system substrate-binding protein